jgi:2-C-methyl-D-erythritol 4-phosphate cytidylyltransferase
MLDFDHDDVEGPRSAAKHVLDGQLRPNMPTRVTALIPAAGSGERLGMGPKAFVQLAGKSLLERAISGFANVDEVIVALPDSHLDVQLPAHVRRVTGGLSRQQSVRNLLEAASHEIVLIHDAARPFLSAEIIQAVIDSVLEVGAATTALPAADTLVFENGSGMWRSLLDRSTIHAIQTPQGFKRELLLEAHERARVEGFAATDDAGLIARLGLPVALVLGDPRLFKVTRPGDYALAEAFAAVWDAQEVARGSARGSDGGEA